MKPIILVGGGGHCKSVIDAAESADYSILGVLDMPDEVGKAIQIGRASCRERVYDSV